MGERERTHGILDNGELSWVNKGKSINNCDTFRLLLISERVPPCVKERGTPMPTLISNERLCPN